MNKNKNNIFKLNKKIQEIKKRLEEIDKILKISNMWNPETVERIRIQRKEQLKKLVKLKNKKGQGQKCIKKLKND